MVQLRGLASLRRRQWTLYAQRRNQEVPVFIELRLGFIAKAVAMNENLG
jgi:hypothetical protein